MVDRLTKQVEKEERDLQILREVIKSGPVGIVRLSDRTEIPEHKIRYSLRMLENDGLIEPTPNGAIPADGLAAELEEMNEGVDDLIERLEALEGMFE